MPALKCDACGGALISYKDGLMKCEYCGLLHTRERINQKVQEIKGAVEVYKGNVERERLLQNAKHFTKTGDYTSAYKTFQILRFDYPADEQIEEEFWKLRVKHTLTYDYDVKNVDPASIKEFSETIQNSKKYSINSDELIAKVVKLYNNFDGITNKAFEWNRLELNDIIDNYGLANIWKRKIDISNKKNEIGYKEGSLNNAVSYKDHVKKSNEEMDSKRTGEIIGALFLLLLVFINIALCTSSLWWILAFFITIPMALSGFLGAATSDNRYSNSKGVTDAEKTVEIIKGELDVLYDDIEKAEADLKKEEATVFLKLME